MHETALSLLRIFVGAIVVTGFVFCVGALYVFEIPTANREAVAILMGALAAKSSNVVNFFFGSSSGSKDKTGTLSKIAEGYAGGRKS